MNSMRMAQLGCVAQGMVGSGAEVSRNMTNPFGLSDIEQTAICNRLRAMLQSIAIMAVQAQDCIGTDKCADLLYDIELDVAKAQKLSSRL